MERRKVAFLWALSAAAVAALLVPEARLDIDALVILLGAGVAANILTGYGGQYLLVCLGEAFAVGLGTASLVLGVLFQPAIAWVLCDDDRMSLIVGVATTIAAAAGVLIFRQSLFLILGVLVASMGIIAGLYSIDAWMQRRLSRGNVE